MTRPSTAAVLSKHQDAISWITERLFVTGSSTAACVAAGAGGIQMHVHKCAAIETERNKPPGHTDQVCIRDKYCTSKLMMSWME